MFFRSSLALLSLALLAVAQSDSTSSTTTSSGAASTPSINSCVLQCLQSSESSGTCSDYTDLSCTCSNSGYQTAVATCIASNCPNELGDATELQASECSNPSASGSSSGSATSGSAKSTGTSPASTASPSASKSAAGALVAPEFHLGAAAVGALGFVLAL